MTIKLLLVLVLSGVLAASSQAAATDTPPTPSCPSYNPPNELTLVAGTPQSAKLGTPFDTNLEVALATSSGCPITTPLAGGAVTFTAPAGGPSGTFAASGSNAVLVGTDASGHARAPMLTANNLPGGYLVTASSSFGSVTFSLVNTASGVAATIEPVSQRSESAAVSKRYHDPLSVRVLDAGGGPVAGASVTFSLGGGAGGGSDSGAAAGGSFESGGAQAVVQTDGTGTATSPRVVANGVAGTFTATASVAGVLDPARFSLDNLAAGALRLRSVGSSAQSATVKARFPRPLAVKVVDSAGRPLAGLTVTFSLGATGAAGGASTGAGATFAGGATQATATTNAAGVARSPRFDAEATAGSFSATASVTGSAHVLAFSLRARAGAPSSVVAGAAGTQTTLVGTRFAVPLAVTVEDKDANPVANVPVRFSAPSAGPTGSFVSGHHHVRTVTVRTNAAGVAVAPALVAGRIPGGYAVRASVAHAGAAAFALVNQPRS